MAIKKESLAAILARIGAFESKEKALEAIEATEEKEVAIPESTKVYSESEFATVTRNLKNEGITTGKELLVKDLKEKAGLDFEGKNPEKFIEEYKKSVLSEANISVDEKVKAKDKTITDLKAALEKEQSEKAQAIEKATTVARDARLRAMLPKDRDDRFTDDQYLTLLKSEIAIAEEDGKEVVKRKGEVMQDDKFNPLPVDQSIAKIFTDSKWVKTAETPQQGGRGGGNQVPPSVYKSLSQFREDIEKQGIHPGSEKATQLLSKAVQDNPQMDMNT